MIQIYGASDDCIEVEGDINEEFAYYEASVDSNVLAFSDGTVLRIVFTQAGVWRISPVAEGMARLHIDQAPEDDDSNYSDRARLTGAAITWVVHGMSIKQA